MRRIILAVVCLAVLPLFAGCSMEQGGTEDPAGFETVQGLEQPGTSETVAVPAPEAALEARLAALEAENARLQSRLNEMETKLTEQTTALEARLAALEAGSMTITTDPSGKPLIDLGDDKAFEEKVVRQGLEQILNMSRLLLDKMEYEMNEKIAGESEAGATSESSTKAGSDNAQTVAQ